jgi:RNA recognition motif-containing protein
MNIYVGNLADDVSEDDLHEVFKVFGQVESVKILKDRFSGKSKGFGFLEMPSTDEAQVAIKEVNGMDIKGAAVKVDEAHPRPVGGLHNRSGPQRRGGTHRGGGSRRGGSGGGRGSGRGSGRGRTRSY